jgi:DNA polymerase-3 subunit delta
MKLQYRQIEPFVKNPDTAARVILVYGPDSGLMRERARQMARTVVADLNDPFNVTVLTGDIISQDSARLSDEANAISMMGGRRLVRVEDAGDKMTATVKAYLANPNPDTVVIIEAGELNTKSSLRALCEKAANAAAIPCYVEDEKDLARFIRDVMQTEKRPIDNDAITWLAAAISGDRARARTELEKLIIYKGSETGPINLNDAQECCGDSGARALDDLIYSVGSRQPDKAISIYNQLIAEGIAVITILRTLQNHFRRLHLTRARIDNGDPIDTVIKSMSPPLFFKLEAPFRAQLQSWSIGALNKVLNRLLELEAQCKQTAMPDETLCAQAVLGIASMKASSS